MKLKGRLLTKRIEVEFFDLDPTHKDEAEFFQALMAYFFKESGGIEMLQLERKDDEADGKLKDLKEKIEEVDSFLEKEGLAHGD